MTIVPIRTAGGEVIDVEVSATPGHGRAARPGEVAVQTLEKALEQIRPLVRSLIQTMDGIDVTPEEVEVKFGVKFTAEANVILSSAATEANLEMTLKWQPKQANTASGDDKEGHG